MESRNHRGSRKFTPFHMTSAVFNTDVCNCEKEDNHLYCGERIIIKRKQKERNIKNAGNPIKKVQRRMYLCFLSA